MFGHVDESPCRNDKVIFLVSAGLRKVYTKMLSVDQVIFQHVVHFRFRFAERPLFAKLPKRNKQSWFCWAGDKNKNLTIVQSSLVGLFMPFAREENQICLGLTSN